MTGCLKCVMQYWRYLVLAGHSDLCAIRDICHDDSGFCDVDMENEGEAQARYNVEIKPVMGKAS